MIKGDALDIYCSPLYNNIMRCYRCNKNKDSSAFNKDKSRKNGYNNRCKDCDRIYKREKRLKNPEHYRLRDVRYNLKHKEQRNNYSKLYRQKNKYKIIAHYLVNQAIKAGLLKKQSCEICGSNRKIDAHHNDYCKPLVVTWLCRNHHRMSTHRAFKTRA